MKLLDWILILFFISLLAFAFLYLNFSKTKSAECLNDPLGYAKSLLPKEASCSCFYVSQKGLIEIRPRNNTL